MAIKSYRDLQVWQKSMDLAELVYKSTSRFPREEAYGLTAQVRRAVVSVPSNIAEGRSRRTTRDFIQFLRIAYASLAEVETQLLLAERLSFIDAGQCREILATSAEVGRMLNGLTRKLRERSSDADLKCRPRVIYP